MSDSFNPFPIVGIAKALFVAIVLSLLVLYAASYIGDWYLLLLLVIWGGTILQIGLLYILAKHQTITLEENSVTYTTGIISHHRTVLPYPRITEASFSQGPVQRIMKVGTLKLDTAGGSQMAIYVTDVHVNDLQKILGDINKKSRRDDSE